MALSKEEKLHQSICRYLKIQYPDVIFTSDGSGVRMHPAIAKKFSALKSSRGIPDLLIFEAKGPYCGLLLEIKVESPFRKDGRLKSSRHLLEQAEMLDRLKHKGYATYFVVGLDMAIAAIDDYMNIKEWDYSRETKEMLKNGAYIDSDKIE